MQAGTGQLPVPVTVSCQLVIAGLQFIEGLYLEGLYKN
jgi:hypothetical protein